MPQAGGNQLRPCTSSRARLRHDNAVPSPTSNSMPSRTNSGLRRAARTPKSAIQARCTSRLARADARKCSSNRRRNHASNPSKGRRPPILCPQRPHPTRRRFHAGCHSVGDAFAREWVDHRACVATSATRHAPTAGCDWRTAACTRETAVVQGCRARLTAGNREAVPAVRAPADGSARRRSSPPRSRLARRSEISSHTPAAVRA